MNLLTRRDYLPRQCRVQESRSVRERNSKRRHVAIAEAGCDGPTYTYAMDNQFWIERWSRGEIGFHQRSVNAYLQQYWSQLGIDQHVRVFVPLCGKSLDMRWLRQQGHPVVGVEIAREAVREFFTEWGVDPQIIQSGSFERWRAQNIELLCGDFFELTRADLANVGAVFDRAALIALPAGLREKYAAKMRDLLPAGTPMLLITVDYAQHEMSGPPFSVGDAEVRTLFAGLAIDLLAELDVTNAIDNARFRQRGVSRLIERVYRIV
jgi:thiopurine S-methyltransferase